MKTKTGKSQESESCPECAASVAAEFARKAGDGSLHPLVGLRRWNVEDREDGLYFCDGLHDKNSPCHWQKMTSIVWRMAVTERAAQPNVVFTDGGEKPQPEK